MSWRSINSHIETSTTQLKFYQITKVMSSLRILWGSFILQWRSRDQLKIYWRQSQRCSLNSWRRHVWKSWIWVIRQRSMWMWSMTLIGLFKNEKLKLTKFQTCSTTCTENLIYDCFELFWECW